MLGGSMISIAEVEQREKEDPEASTLTHSEKIWRTVVLCISFIGLGMCAGIPGPTLLDLMRLTHSTLEQVAWGITSYSAGYLTGAIIGGYMVERSLPSFLLSVTTLAMALTTPIVPLIPNLAAFICVCYVWGVSCGPLDAGAHVLLVKTWKEDNGPYMQTMHFFFAVGATIGPLLAEPFLSPRPPEISPANRNEEHINSSLVNSTVAVYNSSSSNLTSNELDAMNSVQESKIHFSYLIIGLWCLIGCLCNCVIFVKDKRNNKPLWYGKNKKKKAEEGVCQGRKRWKVALLVASFFFYLLYVSLEELFGVFAPVFAVHQLNWTKSSGALLASVYWGSFCAVRGISIFLAHFMSPRQMQIANWSIAVGSSLVFCTLVTRFHVIAWVVSALLGASFASTYPAQVSWMEQRIKFTGGVATIVMMGSSVGGFLAPPLLGNLIKTFGHMTFVYYVASGCFACAIVFVVLEVIGHWLPPPVVNDKNEGVTSREEIREALLQSPSLEVPS